MDQINRSVAQFRFRLRTSTLLLIAVAFFAAAWGTSVAVAKPPSFFALNGGGRNFDGRSAEEMSRREQTWDEIQASGAKVFRLRIEWGHVVYPGSCSSESFDFEQFYDDFVRRAAQHGETILADLYGMPGGCETGNTEYPIPGSADYENWTKSSGFVAAVVKRYGYNGSFWSENPLVPYHPIEAWEVWNEVNAPVNNPGGVVNPQAYAKFAIDSAATIRGAQAEIAPSAQPRVLFGGLSTAGESWMKVGTYYSEIYGNPTKSGPGAYTTEQLHASYDGLGFHPYAQSSTPATAEGYVNTARSTMNAWGDGEKTIWITEIGWPSGKLGVTEAQQNEYLQASSNWFSKEAAAKKIELVAWFFLKDVPEAELGPWASFTGLKSEDGTNRTSWCGFLKLNGRSCATTVATNSAPSIARDGTSGYTFMAFHNSANQIAYSYKSPSEGWVSSTLGGTVAANTSPSMVRSESAQRVFIAYRDNNGRIGYWQWSSGGGWENVILGGGSPGTVAANSSPSVVWDPGNFYAIYYRNTSGGISYWYWTPGGGWASLTLGGSVAAETSPSAQRDPTSGYSFVTYTTSGGKIGYWLWSSGTGWVNSELGGAAASKNASPSVVRSESPAHILIAYRATSNQIAYWNWSTTEGWVNGTLTSSHPVRAGASPSVVWDPNYAGIAYFNSAQGITMWYWTWPSGWSTFEVPTFGWSNSNIVLTRDPTTTNSSWAYANQKGQITNITWFAGLSGAWDQVSP